MKEGKQNKHTKQGEAVTSKKKEKNEKRNLFVRFKRWFNQNE